MRRVASLLLLALAVGCGNVDTTPPEERVASAQDADQDGFADDADFVPCAGVRLLVTSLGVDDATISLNGESIVAPAAFPTSDVIEVFLNVAQGENSIEIESALAGGEQIHVIVERDDKTTRFLDETVTSASALTDVSFGFAVTTACAGY